MEETDLLSVKGRIFNIQRFSIHDGPGVRTIVFLKGCPLRCRWCINPQTWQEGASYNVMTPQRLLSHVRVDDLYFQATGGGIMFGGGEPALRSRFIEAFRTICPKEWKINIETSMNVPQEHLERLMPVVDEYMIDIKDMNPRIYREYTGMGNEKVMSNLERLAAEGLADRCIIRIPLIPDFNTDEDRENSVRQLQEMGFTRFDRFDYIIKNNR